MGLQTEKDKEKDDPKKNYKLCSKKFETDELEVLKKIYKELGSRSISNHIDKETFLQFFPLPGLWGERLFLKFNFKNTGYIDFEEFIIGIAICCRGTKSDKINVLFDIFDLNSDGYIQKSEMVAMLSNIPYIHKLKNIFFKKSNSTNYYDNQYEGNSNADHNESYNDGYNDDYNYNYVDYYDYNQNNNNNNMTNYNVNICVNNNNNNQHITNNNANYSDSYNEYCDSENEDEYNDDKNENNDENYYFDKMSSEKRISNDSINLKDIPQGNCSKCLKQKNRMMYNDKLLSMKEIAKKIRKEKKHHLEKCIKDIRRERYGNDLGNQRNSNTIRKNNSIVTNNSISNCKKEKKDYEKKNLITKTESDDNNSNFSSSSVSNVFTNEDGDFHNLCKKRIIKNKNRKKGSNSMQYLKNTNSAFMSSTSDSSYSYETISRLDSDDIDSFSSNKEQRNGSCSETSDSFISIYGYLIKSKNRTTASNKKRKDKHELDHRLLIEKRKNSWDGSIRSKITQEEKDKEMEGKESEEIEKKKKSQTVDINNNNNAIEHKENESEGKDKDADNNNTEVIENKDSSLEKKDQDGNNNNNKNNNNDGIENKDSGVEKRESNWEKKETNRSSYNRNDVNIYKKEKKIEKKRKLFSNEHCLPSKTARNILNDEENEEYSDKNVDVEEIVDIMLEECEFMDNDKITQIQFKSVIHKYDFFLYVFFSCLHEDIWGLQGNVLYGRDYISNFVIKPENFKNKQIGENDEIITEDLYFKIRQLFIVQAPDYDCVNDNLCVNFLKEQNLTNDGIDYASDDYTNKKKKVSNELENNSKTKEKTSKDAEKFDKNEQIGQTKEDSINTNSVRITHDDTTDIINDKEFKIYALENKEIVNTHQTIIEKEKREDELIKENQSEIKIQNDENMDTHEIKTKEIKENHDNVIKESNDKNAEASIKCEDVSQNISQNNSGPILNVNNSNSFNPNDKGNYAEKEGNLNENKNDINILPKIGNNTKLVIWDNIKQKPGYECDFNLLTNSMNDIFSKEIVEFIQASKISFNISDVRKERNPQHKDKHKKTKRNIDKTKNNFNASLIIKKKHEDDSINNNHTLSDTKKENAKKTTNHKIIAANNNTYINNGIHNKKEIVERNILKDSNYSKLQNANDNDTNKLHLNVDDSVNINREIKKSIVTIKMQGFVENSGNNKTDELKDANISIDQHVQPDPVNVDTELNMSVKVKNGNKKEEISNTTSEPHADPVITSSNICIESKVAREKTVEEQKGNELAANITEEIEDKYVKKSNCEIGDKSEIKVKKEESSSIENESYFFEGKKKKKKNDIAKKHVKDCNLYSCPNCKGPFLMCPNCHNRYPRFCVKEDKIAMECEYCDCEHCYFYNCIYCNFDFQKCLNMVKKNSLKEGILYKIGKHLHQFKARYYILFDSLLYYYDKKNNLKPRGFMFLEGCYVEVIPKNDSINKYGFSICHKGTNQIQKRNLYVNTYEEREEWLQALYSTTKQNTLYNLYEIHEQLGQGKFSKVYRGINKQTNSEFAIKVINNRSVSIYEKELLRSEISILRLLRHPNVIFLKEIINTKETLYISMELVKGGELYDFLLSETRLSEIHANKIISQLIKTVAYLHKCGIIHRDIKPENILLTDKSKDAQIKLTDFGLSTLCAPNELLKEPCGTLAYVAPEVITLQGYNHKVDAWSIGVILYLLLSGKLPFPINKNTEMNIQKTYVLSFRDNIWKTISSSAKDLISKLLELNADKRISASEALEHIWIKNPTAVINENSVIYKNEEINILNLQDVSVSTFNIPKYAPYHAEQKKIDEGLKNENSYSFHQDNNMICENNYSNDDPIIPLPYSGSMIKETSVDKNPALNSNNPNSDARQGISIENMENLENYNTSENKTNTSTRDNEQLKGENSKDDATNT
ncbi:calcium-dependent protein kinase 7 [Plasmodium berghei]|uniref:non-specific serine/threonine protein kinase n=1 Tax=Plasmodium berghei TaxID=5821 RepID=A0A0Y9WP20_PLABE|nr:calcium-dependent protein kinase 7 [Plasmodium berghei]